MYISRCVCAVHVQVIYIHAVCNSSATPALCGSTAKGLVTVHLQAECGGHRGTAAGGRMQTPTGDASLHGRSQ